MSLRDRILTEIDRREQMARWITEVRPGPWRAVATHVDGALDGGQRIFAAPVPGHRPGATVERVVVDIPLHPVDRSQGQIMAPMATAGFLLTVDPADALRRYDSYRRLLAWHDLDDEPCAGDCTILEILADALGITRSTT